MKRVVFLAFLPCWFFSGLYFLQAQDQTKSGEVTEMNNHVEGEFTVAMVPQQDQNSHAHLGRMTLNKTYTGPLTATGLGQMLTGMTAVKGSAAYVAMERVEGTLDGKSGSFIIHHAGTMSGASQELTIKIVPDSGTEELLGISGVMTIKIEGGKHFYLFDYSLPK